MFDASVRSVSQREGAMSDSIILGILVMVSTLGCASILLNRPLELAITWRKLVLYIGSRRSRGVRQGRPPQARVPQQRRETSKGSMSNRIKRLFLLVAVSLATLPGSTLWAGENKSDILGDLDEGARRTSYSAFRQFGGSISADGLQELEKQVLQEPAKDARLTSWERIDQLPSAVRREAGGKATARYRRFTGTGPSIEQVGEPASGFLSPADEAQKREERTLIKQFSRRVEVTDPEVAAVVRIGLEGGELTRKNIASKLGVTEYAAAKVCRRVRAGLGALVPSVGALALCVDAGPLGTRLARLYLVRPKEPRTVGLLMSRRFSLRPH